MSRCGFLLSRHLLTTSCSIQRKELQRNWSLIKSIYAERLPTANLICRRQFAQQFNNQTKSSTNYVIPALAAGTAISLGLYLTTRSNKQQSAKDTSTSSTTIKLVDDLPDSIQHLIIGGGTAAFSAFRAIRSNDPNAKVLVITDEERRPYMRPPLSKELWFESSEVAHDLTFRKWSGDQRSLYFEKQEFFCPLKDLPDKEHGGVSLITGHKVVRIEPAEQRAYLDSGQVVKYDKCLIATGGKPKNLPVFENAPPEVKERLILYRSADDFLKLFELFEKAKSITIVGGGFLGSELACVLGRRKHVLGLDVTVTQMFPEAGVLAKVLPEYLSTWSTGKVRAEGNAVTLLHSVMNRNVLGTIVMENVDIVSASKNDGRVSLKLSNGTSHDAEYIVVAVGLEPNTELAATSGLEVDPVSGGFVVNAELEARSNLFVAGDASSFYDIQLGRRRVEHYDHAIVSGRLAGQNMVGLKQPYTNQSMFWSDLGPDIGFEAVGLVDSSLDTVAVFAKDKPPEKPVTATNEDKKDNEEAANEDKKPEAASKPKSGSESDHELLYRKGIVFYLRDQKIVGMVMWNLFNRLGLARRVLKENRKYDDLAEVAKLFELYADDDEDDLLE